MFTGGSYRERGGTAQFSQAELLGAAAAGELLVTLTGRAGVSANGIAPPPALWPVGDIEAQTRNVELDFLAHDASLRVKGRHVEHCAIILLDGRKVDGVVSCESGSLPDCDNEVIIINLQTIPGLGGLHFLQVQNPAGLISNDMMFFSEQWTQPAKPGNLIASGGSFNPGMDQFEKNWNTVEIATNSIVETNGEVRVNVRAASTLPWHAQISHSVMVTKDQQYNTVLRRES